jgi:hypothetical protein
MIDLNNDKCPDCKGNSIRTCQNNNYVVIVILTTAQIKMLFDNFIIICCEYYYRLFWDHKVFFWYGGKEMFNAAENTTL